MAYADGGNAFSEYGTDTTNAQTVGQLWPRGASASNLGGGGFEGGLSDAGVADLIVGPGETRTQLEGVVAIVAGAGADSLTSGLIASPSLTRTALDVAVREVWTEDADDNVSTLVEGPSFTRTTLDDLYMGRDAFIINALDYGILNDGSDQTVQIQALLDTFAGRIIYFPPGIYAFIVVSVSTFTTLIGVRGATSFRLLGTGLGNGMARMKIYDAHHVTIRDITFTETNVVSRTGTFGCISTSGAYNLLIEGVEINSGSGTGMHFMSTDNVMISNCTVRNTQADGIHAQRGSSNVFVNNCRVYDNGDDAIGFVSHAEATAGYCTDITISNCILGPNKTGYIGSGIALIGCIGATVTGNAIRGTASGGVRITSIGEGSEGFAVVGNIVITGNRISNVGFYTGPVAGQLSSGVDIFNARNVLVADNIIDKAYGNGVTVSQCSVDVTVKNNEIRRPGSRGVFVATLRQTGSYLEIWSHPSFEDQRVRPYVSHHNLTISDNQINAPGLGGITVQGISGTNVEGLTVVRNVLRAPNGRAETGVSGVLLSYITGLFCTLNDVGASGGSVPITDYNASSLTSTTLLASNYSTIAF